MSAVDVLYLLEIANIIAITTGHEEDEGWAEKFLEARDAVAELVEANRVLIQQHDEDAKLANFDRCGCSVCVALRPALARITGEPA